MNLIQRKGPEYSLIPDSFISSFEAKLLESYISRIEDERHLAFNLPKIDTDLMFNDGIDNMTWAAAYLGYKNGDKNYFTKAMEGKSLRDAEDITDDICGLLEMTPNHNFDDDMYLDVKTFFDFNCMSYIDIHSESFGVGTSGYFYTNLPIRQVW